MGKEETIDVLNTLVVTNNDRIEGYKKAFVNTKEIDLKDLFLTFEQTSKKCLGELIREINKLVGKAVEGTTASGNFFRIWMDVKSALKRKNRNAILNSCEYGEKQAVQTYQKVLEDKSEYLTFQQQLMIMVQQKLLKADQKKIKLIHNVLV